MSRCDALAFLHVRDTHTLSSSIAMVLLIMVQDTTNNPHDLLNRISQDSQAMVLSSTGLWFGALIKAWHKHVD